MDRSPTTIKNRLPQRLFLLGLLSTCILLEQGCNSGQVGAAAFSTDGQTLVFMDSNWPEVYMADGRGVRHVARADRFAISNTGNYAIAIETDEYILGCKIAVHEPRQDNRLTLMRVADGKCYATSLPRVPEGYWNQLGESQWPVSALEVYIEDTPAVVFGLLDGHDRFPGASIPKEPMAYLRWKPDLGWEKANRPPQSARVRLLDESLPAIEGWGKRPIVEFGPDGWNARRTIWVLQDGKTMELLRQNDVPGRLTILIALMPIGIWNPGYYVYALAVPITDLRAQDQSQPKARVAQLVAQRMSQTQPARD